MYIIKSRNLAGAISFITRQDFKELDDKYSDNKIYGFEDNKKFKKALKEITKLRLELN